MYKIQKFRVALVKDGRASVAEYRAGSVESAISLFRPVLGALPHEEVWIALLSARHDVLGLVKVGQGGMHGCGLKPSDVLRPVIVGGAYGYIVAHNHPSGDPSPSASDIEMTRHLTRASELVGVDCLDHLILARGGGWRSLRDVPGCFANE